MTDIRGAGNGGNVFATERVGGSSRRVLRFPKGNGLSVSTAGRIPRTRYSIVVRFRFNETSGYRRIIDFSNGGSDAGVYVLSGRLNFFTQQTGSVSLFRPSSNGDPYFEVMITRSSSGVVVVYVDGVEQVRFQDNNSRAVIHSGQTLRFFADDRVVQNEHSAGAVAAIELWDGPLAGPPPHLGVSAGVRQTRGTVLVQLPRRSRSAAYAAQTRGRFVPLQRVRRVPMGSLLDTSRGEVLLTTAANRRGKLQRGRFTGGRFKVTQSRRSRDRGRTDLTLLGGSFNNCTARGSVLDEVAQIARRTKRRVRRLRGNARGRYRTRGRYSAATVRGTDWSVTDRCDGTLTQVRRGRVDVRDFKRRRTVSLRAGRSYLARAPG
jgi:hypothetical protein